MDLNDLVNLMPLLIIASAPVIIMLFVTIVRNFRLIYLFTMLMYMAAFGSLFFITPYQNFENLIVIDSYGILFLGIIYITAILITVLSYEYLRIQAGEREEYFIIMLVAVLGASVLVLSEHFISFFLGLETLSISLYILIAYLKWRDYCIEAGVKFLVIASLSTAFLLFGMGLIYAETGTMIFGDILKNAGEQGMDSPILLTGLILMLAGIGFKLALVPFHMWTPDIYQGAPAPVTTFIATISKGAVLALALRLFFAIRGYEYRSLIIVISVISIISMFTGNFLALRQKSVKRLLAYSSIAQLGYLVITLLTGTDDGIRAAVFYLAAYMITTTGAFGMISILSVCERDADNIEDMKGLFWNNPLISVALVLSMLSLAGLPLTAGFISKFYLVVAGVKSGLWLLAFSLIVNSAISLYYYLRVIMIMFAEPERSGKLRMTSRVIFISVIVIAGIVMLGILPSFLTEIISTSTFNASVSLQP
jgi:NADH-quinone oxidoreductase subunit N